MNQSPRLRFVLVVSGVLLAIILVVPWSGHPNDGSAGKTRPTAKPALVPVQADSQAASEVPGAKISNEARYSVDEVLALGKSDLAAALEYINRSYDHKTREVVLGRLMMSLAREKLEVIAILASEFTDSIERITAIAMIAEYWAARDISKLLDYADKELNISLRNEVYQRSVECLANRGDFDQAAGVLKKMPFSDKRTNAISALAQKMAIKNPDEALKWYKTFDEPQDAGTALSSLVRTFSGEGNRDSLTKLLELVPPASRGNIEREIGTLMGSEGIAALSGTSDVNERDRLLSLIHI